jgi:hypothetical protein
VKKRLDLILLEPEQVDYIDCFITFVKRLLFISGSAETGDNSKPKI